MAATPSDGASSRATRGDDARVGSVLADRYRIDLLVGEGGMGKVYSAEHVHMRKKVAVKVLHRELTAVPEVVARFEREAMAAANIEHPNVAAATDFGKAPDGAVFLVLEFVQGKNLRDEIAAAPLQLPRALHVARQIANALGAAHAQGIVHRDLKPENVMLIEKRGDPDFVKVLDFGIAKVPIDEPVQDAPRSTSRTGHVITKAGMVFGTPEYMAPEQALGQTVDGRADLYALGIILFEMISGNRPFTGDDKASILGQQLSKPPPTLKERTGTDVPEAVEQIVARLLARDVASRFQKAEEVSAAIEAIIGPIPRLAQASSPGLPTPPPHVGKPTFLPNDPLPRFPSAHTLPRVDGLQGVLQELANQPAPPLAVAPESTGESAPPLLDRVKAAARAAWPRARASLSQAGATLDKTRDRWPHPVRRKLARVSGETLVAAGSISAGALLLAVAIGFSVDGGEASDGALPDTSARTSAAEAPSTAPLLAKAPSQAELDQAKAGGAAALSELALRYPSDASVQLELADALSSAKQYLKAVGALGNALSRDPAAKDDKRAARVLFQAAQAKESEDAAFALLQGPMAGRGADILYDLVVQKGVKPVVQKRAEGWVRGDELPGVASPALAIAVAVRKSKNCQEVRGHLPRVKEVGDERSLPYLEFFKRKSQHYSCLVEGGLLEDTLSSVRSRAGK